MIEMNALAFELAIIRYLKEEKPHGSAGGLYNFRDMIMEDSPVRIFMTHFLFYFSHEIVY